MMFMFIIVSIAGNVMAGEVGFARTPLTADIAADATTITVASTNGFPDTGIIVIGDERIAHANKTATTFVGNLAQPLLRGTQDTEAVAHSSGERVSTVPGAMMNTAVNYHIAVMADASGLQAFVAKPTAAFQLLGSFFFLPLSFLGTDLAIITIFWAVFGAGMLFSVVMTMAGGRRV